mgnify:CR=1 FL=1
MEEFLLLFSEKNIEKILALGYKLFYCIIVFVVCLFLVQLSRKSVKRFLMKQAANNKVPVDERKANTVYSIVSSIIKYLLYFIALCTILTELGVEKSSLIAVAGAASVAVGLGAQNVIQDMLDGFFILFEDHFGVGDIVEIQGKTGTVESITMRTTKIRDANGAVHIFPNGSIGTITNYCKEYMNAIVDVGIAYEENIEKVITLLKNEMEKIQDIDFILETPQVLGVVALEESSVTIRIIAKCQIKQNLAVERELRQRIKSILDEQNITMPFPQRTIHIINE